MPRGIAPSDRDYFTVNICGTLYRLCGLPMGWSLSPYVLLHDVHGDVRQAPTLSDNPRGAWQCPAVALLAAPRAVEGSAHLTIRRRFLVVRLVGAGGAGAPRRVADLLDSLGLLRNPAKGLWESVQYGEHLRVDIDTATGYIYAPVDKLQRLARQAKQLLQRAARDARWLPVRELHSLAGRAQYLFLAIPAARFYLRELHDVVGSKWGGRVRMTHQLRRDLQWWTAVPTQANGRPIHRHVETAYMHCDSSGYGWGAVLNGMLEARGFWGAADERRHITWKELKAVRLAVESFLPHIAGRRVLLHEDNHAVCSVLAGLTSRSPAMMAELRKLCDDWQLDPVIIAELEAMWGAHSVDRFASAMNAMIQRYNAAWSDHGCEAVDSLHLFDAEWRHENNYCNPRWPLLPDLVQKLRQSGAAATVVAPRWEGKLWHQALTEMAVAERVGVPPLGGTAATVARYIAWHGLRGTVKVASLQPYLSAINGFYRDHSAEPVAQGDLISKVRKGLAASQAEPDPPGVRTDVPARLIAGTLRLAETLREELGPTWTRDQLPRILLFRAAVAVVAMYVFYARGKAGRRSLPNGRFDVYCSQRGLPAARWAGTHDEPAASWTSATVTDWLQLVAHMLEERPPPGFVWTSHSLRKGAATTAHAIGVVLQKIKDFGGWAQLFNVVLDYINPTALPCAAASWQLFGWHTPWGGPPATGGSAPLGAPDGETCRWDNGMAPGAHGARKDPHLDWPLDRPPVAPCGAIPGAQPWP
eukprot:jgi/Tetstr1/428469/TSEL_018480.t1